MPDKLQVLLDTPLGQECWVWLLQFRLADTQAIYPVKFLGFTGVAVNCSHIVVTNPDSCGYSATVQDPNYRFRAAAYLKTVPLSEVFLTPEEAVTELIRQMTWTGFSDEVIRDFLSRELAEPLTAESDIVAEVSQELRKDLDDRMNHARWVKMIADGGDVNDLDKDI